MTKRTSDCFSHGQVVVDVTTALDDFLNSIGVLSIGAASAKVAPHMVLGSFNGSGSDFTSHFSCPHKKYQLHLPYNHILLLRNEKVKSRFCCKKYCNLKQISTKQECLLIESKDFTIKLRKFTKLKKFTKIFLHNS